MPDPGFRSAYDIRVRFAETDAQGIAHHASYVVWLEVARVAYLADHAGGYRSIQAQGIEALTTGVSVDYRVPAAFDDVLTIHLRCVGIRGARFRYEYRIERDGELDRDGRDAPCHGRRRDATADARAAVVRGRDRYGRTGVVAVGVVTRRAGRRRRSGRSASSSSDRPRFGFFGLTGFFGGSFVPTRTSEGSPT